MNKLKDFTKKYGFYLAVGVISVSAVGAAIVLSQGTTQVDSANGAYVEDALNQNVEVTGESVEGVLPSKEEVTETLEPSTSEEIIEVEENVEANVEVASNPAEAPKEGEDDLVAETFSSTTAEGEETPFFAEGDHMAWPVEGEVIVPFKDDNTSHWYSTALEQTMRTYGICISADEGEAIKAPAKGVVVDIIDDATTLDSMKLVGDVGRVIVIDHGNGYTTELGIQEGTADVDLLGQTVDAMQVVGQAGKAKGPFADLGTNVYMRVKHGEDYVDPTTILSMQEEVAGVDMGHTEDQQ